MSEEMDDSDTAKEESDDVAIGSLKKPVVLELYRNFELHEPIYSHHITAAIEATKANLGKANPANFLKDIDLPQDFRTKSCLRDGLLGRGLHAQGAIY